MKRPSSGQCSGTVHCPRWVKTAATKAFESEDLILPNGIRESDMLAFPEHISETYEECWADVPYSGSWDDGCYVGPPEDCYPAEESIEFDSCPNPRCNTHRNDWTDDEIKSFKEEISNV